MWKALDLNMFAESRFVVSVGQLQILAKSTLPTVCSTQLSYYALEATIMTNSIVTCKVKHARFGPDNLDRGIWKPFRIKVPLVYYDSRL